MSLDHTGSTDGVGSRERSFVDGEGAEEGTSVLDFAAVSGGKDDSVFLLGSSLPPSAGLNADYTYAAGNDNDQGEEDGDDGQASGSTSAGSFVVNTFIERSGQGAGGTQLRAAVQALRGPGGGILADASEDAEGAAEEGEELKKIEEKMKGLGMGGVGGGKSKGLMGLFEPLSPEGGASFSSFLPPPRLP